MQPPRICKFFSLGFLAMSPAPHLSLVPPADEPPELANALMEQSLLGALLSNIRLLDNVTPDFRGEHLAIDGHADIFLAIQAAAETLKSGPALVEVINLLGADVSLRQYCTQMLGMAISFLPDHIVSCATLVSDLWRRRALLAAMDEVRRDLTSDRKMPAAAILAKHQTQVETITSDALSGRRAVMFDDALDLAMAELDEAIKRDGPAGLLVGMDSVDDAIGGLEAGNMMVLGARPGSGKSALGAKWAINVARQGVGVSIIALEMKAAAIARRVLSELSGVSAKAIRRGDVGVGDMDRIIKARKELRGLPLSIEDCGGLTASEIALKCRLARRRHGLGLVMVDHLHIVRPEIRGGRQLEATHAVAEVAHMMKALAQREEIPVLLLAQLNRALENRDDKRPTLADLRQSGAIEEDADLVAFIHRPEMYLGDQPPEQRKGQAADRWQQEVNDYYSMRDRVKGTAELIIAKNREGEPRTVRMLFDGALTKFSEAPWSVARGDADHG